MSLHYDPPNGSYTSTIPRGVAAFRSVCADHFGFVRTEVVRDQSRCNAQGSEHCECGAIDFFTLDCLGLAARFAAWCVTHADILGIQSVISCRRVWGFGVWAWRDYGGPSPHTDHVHVGLNRWARTNLTRDMVRAQLGDDDLDATQAKQLSDTTQRAKNIEAFLTKVGTGEQKVVADLEVDHDLIATKVAQKLGPQIAEQIADLLAARLKE